MDHRIVKMNGGGYCAEIDLQRGGNCVSLRSDKYSAQILREPGEILDNPYLYGMPILFPVNRISRGRFIFEDREYIFPINEPKTQCHLHGYLHETPFLVSEQTENKLSCIYRADDDHPYLQFPHSFDLSMVYELSENGLLHTTKVHNRSESNMPVMLGFHTTFNARFCPGKGQVLVRVPIAEEYERNMENYLPTGNKPAFDCVTSALNQGIFDPFSAPISRHYRGNGKMVIYDKEKDLSVVYEIDEKLGFRLIYNGNADGYICLEPQTSLANSPNSPISRVEAGFGWLAPGQTVTYNCQIHIERGDWR